MSEREEALRQISEIKSHLIDTERFFPYNYNACHIWSAIAVILTLGMVWMYEQSLVIGTIFMIIFISIGFMVEGLLTKKVNRMYDIDDCTQKQRFIMNNFLMITLFMIVLSTIFAFYKLYVLGLLTWLFSISLGYFSVGFVSNIERFSKMAQFNMVMALILLSVGAYFNLLVGVESLFYTLVQAVVIFGLAVLPTSIAWNQQKEERFTKEECSV